VITTSELRRIATRSRDDIMIALLESFGQPYRGLRFQLDQSNDSTETGQRHLASDVINR
jgi:hypothetical protein